MKYYSDKVQKLFENEEDLKKAEKEFDEAQAEKEKRKEELLITKKEMASAIEKANLNIDEARENYANEYKKAEEIISKARQEAEDILKPAREKIEEAQRKKYDAVKEFNKKYGPYTVSYTGEKAYNEFKRNSDWFNSLINNFRWFF